MVCLTDSTEAYLERWLKTEPPVTDVIVVLRDIDKARKIGAETADILVDYIAANT